MFENSYFLRQLSKWTTTLPNLARRPRGWESSVPGVVAGDATINVMAVNLFWSALNYDCAGVGSG